MDVNLHDIDAADRAARKDLRDLANGVFDRWANNYFRVLPPDYWRAREDERAGVARDAAGVRAILTRLQRQVDLFALAFIQPRDLQAAALVLTRDEWDLLRHGLAYWEFGRQGFGPEGARPMFRGYPIVIVNDPLHR